MTGQTHGPMIPPEASEGPHSALGEDFFRRLAEDAPDVIFRLELIPQYRYSYVSPASANLVGYAPEELRTDPDLVRSLVHPEDLERLRATVESGGLPALQTVRLVHRDGRMVWVGLRLALIRDADGRLVAVEGIARDVSVLREAEAALRDSEIRFRTIYEGAPVGMVLLDLDGRPLERNPALVRLLGIQPEESASLTFRDLTIPEDLALEEPLFRELTAGKRDQYQLEKRLRARSGAVVWVRVSVSLVRGEEGEPRYAVVILEDIHLRKQAEEAVRESERRYRQLADSLPQTVFEMNLSGQLTFVNETAYRQFGVTPSEMAEGINILNHIVPEDHERVKSDIERKLKTGETEPPEYTAVRKDGTTFPCVVSSVTIMQGEMPVGLRGFLMDITERKRIEEQLMYAERMEAAGLVAGQVAHDFNNLLSPVMAFTELLKMRLADDESGLRYCDEMLSAIRQMAEINKDLLALGRRGSIAFETVDLICLVQQTVSEIVDRPESLSLQVEASPDLLPVKGSEAQLHRVLSNLVLNAREAMRDTGSLRIRMENVGVDVPINGRGVQAGQYVRLSVEDTGCGIAPDIRTRVFDAFFTTKRADRRRGSGLGLSVVQAIVADHNGYVDLDSSEGKGTTFNVYLPASEESVPPRSSKRLRGGTEKLLVVDDDDLQLKAAEELLSHLGYEIETAASGEAALECLAENPVDLAVLDMVMPRGIDGVETYRRALSVRPGLRAIFVSGYAESERVRQARELGVVSFVDKPVSFEKLAEAVRAELDRRK